MTGETSRLRPLLPFAAASFAAVALGAFILSASGLPPGSWIRNPLAWAAGALLAAAVAAVRRSTAVTIGTAVSALLGLGATFLAPAQEGVHRWVDLGPLHVNVAALLLPPAIVALAFAGIWTRAALALAAAIAALLVLQPDASQATGFAFAAAVLLIRGRVTRGVRIAALGAAFLCAAVAWTRPDPLQPVAEVEEIFSLGLGVSPLIAAAAAIALALAALSPLAAGSAAGEARRDAALALAAYFVAIAVCPLLGAYPVPLVGLGMSFVVGPWLGLGLLCAKPADGAP